MIPSPFIGHKIIMIHDIIKAWFALKIVLEMLCFSVLRLCEFPPVCVDTDYAKANKLILLVKIIMKTYTSPQ
jgi:hypothetical protein